MAAPIVNTYETYDAKGIREELSDIISMITPEETPFISNIGERSIDSVHPEWQTDTLATPDVTNNRPEGSDWTFQAVVPTVRVGDYAQISDKRIIISATLEAVKKAGRRSEIAREVRKKGLELKIDKEVILLSNQASSAGSGDGATNRTLGGLRAWLATNDDLGAGGASGGFNAGTGVVDAATNGTQRAFTKVIMDNVIASTYTAGGNVSMIMGSPYVKRVFSSFMSDANVATQRYVTPKSGQTKIVGAADTYESDFGEMSFVVNRQMARAGASIARNVFFLDTDKLAVGVLRPINLVNVAKTGDAEKRVLVTEYTLIVDNEASQGVAADIFGLTAAS
jgi:hypothetical protein